MRGTDSVIESLLGRRHLQGFVPQYHLLSPVGCLVNQALKNIEPGLSRIYAVHIKIGRSCTASEKLLCGMLLEVHRSIHSVHMITVQTQRNPRLRWSIGTSMDDPVFVLKELNNNREHPIAQTGVIATSIGVLAIAEQYERLSGKCLCVHRALIHGWTVRKGSPVKNGGDKSAANFRGKRRNSGTHESNADADARLNTNDNTTVEQLYRSRILNNYGHGLIASGAVTTATGHADRAADKAMTADEVTAAGGENSNFTPAPGKGHDTSEFIKRLTQMRKVSNVAQNASYCKSAVLDHFAKIDDYGISRQNSSRPMTLRACAS